MSELISIILPTYNRSHLLSSAIDSVLFQDYTNFELIIVDDGSTDDTKVLLQQYNDPRIITIFQENKGVSSARNAALKIAHGQYIAFLDSDDLYNQHKLTAQLKFFEQNPSVDLIYTAANCIDINSSLETQHVYEAPVSGKIYPYISFLTPVTVTIPSVMFKRHVFEHVGFFDESMYRFEDIDYWRRVSKAFNIASLNVPTVTIRTHSSNHLTSQNPLRIVQAIKYYAEKVEREDSDSISLLDRQSGLKRLCNYYIRAFKTLTTSDSESAINELLNMRDSLFCPLVSIIIPVYNGSEFLDDSITSALGQTYKNIEIIVVNDGSSDNHQSRDIALKYGSRLRYYEKINGGVASALNFGISKARGELIAWLSHDDIYPDYKIEAQVNFLSTAVEPTTTVLYGDYAVFHGTDISTKHHVCITPPPPDLFRLFITTQNVLHGCTLLIPTDLFNKVGLFDESLITTQDYDLWFRMSEQAHFIHMHQCLVYARSHDKQGSLSMPDIVSKECDELLSNFVNSLTPQEVLNVSESNLCAGYNHLHDNLSSRGFKQAAITAKKLAVSSNLFSYRYPGLSCPEPSSWTKQTSNSLTLSRRLHRFLVRYPKLHKFSYYVYYLFSHNPFSAIVILLKLFCSKLVLLLTRSLSLLQRFFK